MSTPQPLTDSHGQPFKPLARWHAGLEEWVLTCDRPQPFSDHVQVRRANGSTYHAAWAMLRDISQMVPPEPVLPGVYISP